MHAWQTAALTAAHGPVLVLLEGDSREDARRALQTAQQALLELEAGALASSRVLRAYLIEEHRLPVIPAQCTIEGVGTLHQERFKERIAWKLEHRIPPTPMP